MTTEHEEAQSEALADFEESKDITRRQLNAAIWCTETTSALMEAKATFWRALGAAVSIGALTGVAWSVWWWVR